MTRIPKLVFKLGTQTLYSASYPYRSEDVPRRGDRVTLPGDRRRYLVVENTHVYGKRGLLRIEIALAKPTKTRRR
jgi:hypothetical protein